MAKKHLTEKQQMIRALEKRIKTQDKNLHNVNIEYGEKAGAIKKRTRLLKLQLQALKK